MAVKIRLQRHGRKKRPFYFIVAADERAKRDGKFIERLGSYNPLTIPATIELDRDKAVDWVMKGAKPTNTVKKILTFKGVLYKKHLLRGLAKGALTEQEVEDKFKAWIEEKEAKVQDRIKKELDQIAEKREKRNKAEQDKRTAKLAEKEAALAEEAAKEAEAEEAENAETEAEETTQENVDTPAEETASEDDKTEDSTKE